MDGRALTTSYEQTGYFSKIVIDYLKDAPQLHPFFSYPPTVDGIKEAIKKRGFTTEARQLLVSVLQQQYANISSVTEVTNSINLLFEENTFTVCTAHQPNILSGPLYFIYKILHAIKLAQFLKNELPQNNFVPVYYMGSEDADLDELNHITVAGKKYVWDTKQTGAVGRMLVDNKLVALINELEGQLSVETYGAEIISIIRESYTEGTSIQVATFHLVHSLFAKYGLLVLIPDDARLKGAAYPLFENELLHQASLPIVEQTINELSKNYKTQAHPRDINLFYLKENIRERIIRNNTGFKIHNTDIHFTQEEIIDELKVYPERFSPNVILRGLFQETVLPNIAFIGGGGELAYWLQLKDLFNHYNTAFPTLILRNSFLIIQKKWVEKLEALNLELNDLFLPEDELIKKVVQQATQQNLYLQSAIEKTEFVYDEVKQQVETIDSTLVKHVLALKRRAIDTLAALEKKMLRAEKKKFGAQKRGIEQLKNNLFPNKNLQERIENISNYYAKWGNAFIDELYKNSPSLEHQFTILQINNGDSIK